MNKSKYQINKVVFIPAITILTIFILAGVFYQEQVGHALNFLLYQMVEYFGGYINILSLCCLFFAGVFIIYKYGDIKIGGKDVEPMFSMFNWCAISICGGIGTGLLFWAMGEPIFHLAAPPIGANVEPFSRDAGVFAVSQAMWNWSFIQYSMYSLCAVAFAIVTYNKRMSLSFNSIVRSTFGKDILWLENLINCLIIFCLSGAVANSMGVGLMQIGAGLEAAFGIKETVFVWLIIAVVMGFIFILSCVSGIGKGLKKISSITIYIFLFLLAYVFIFGDTVFITKISTEAVGKIMDTWGTKTTILNTMAPEDTWSADWIVQYWSSFIVYAPVIGMFLSRMARGRTIREFVMVNIFVPSLFCWIWIGIFGGMTISLQTNHVIDVWKVVNESGMQTTVYQILGSLPLGSFITILFLVAVCFSFCTLADPMAAALATIAVKDLEIDDEAPKGIKIIMGIIITVSSYLLVASGGVNSVKGMFVLVGLLISLIMIICIIASFKLASEESRES